MTPLETLKAARQLISDPAKWTQGEFARDATGYAVRPINDDCVCFCALGAIAHVDKTHKLRGSAAEKYLSKLCEKSRNISIGIFNDTHTHAEVLALFDAAIAELEGV